MRELLDRLQSEEKELQFDSFSNSLALELGLFLVNKAGKDGLSLAVHIDRYGQCLFHHALDGTTIDNDKWMAGKIRVVYHYQHSSFHIGRLLEDKDKSISRDYFLDPKEYRPFGGAFPLFLRNAGIIGVVAVSGLPERDDHEFLVRALREFLKG